MLKINKNKKLMHFGNVYKFFVYIILICYYRIIAYNDIVLAMEVTKSLLRQSLKLYRC